MRTPSPATTERLIKPLLFIAALLPLLWLGWRAINGGLGANPPETLIHETGIWALRLLCLVLLLNPLRRWTGWHALLKLRRMLGLWVFAYACLHVLAYLLLEHAFDGGAIIQDLIKRPYISIGMVSFLLLIPLALTSSNAMIQRLGGGNWRSLHQLIYIVAIGAVVHFWWQSRADFSEPLFYGVLIGILLLLRLPNFRA